MAARRLNCGTGDLLRAYDLAPQASELLVVVGPDDVNPDTIDPDNLPAGFRWISNYEFLKLFPIPI
jgi:hypothetical protein